MRKILSVVLVLMVIVSIAAIGVAEEGGSKITSFEATITNALEKQAKDWVASDDMRAMLTVLLTLDFTTSLDDSQGDLTPDLSRTSFVGKDGLDLYVYMHSAEKDVLIMYRPITGNAVYSTMDSVTDTIAQIALGTVCSDEIYKNDVESVYTVVQELQGIFGN